MKICIIQAEPSEQQFLQQELAEYELHFADKLEDIGTHPDVLSIFIHSRIDDAFLELQPQLKLIATRSTTLDHIDMEACNRRGIAVRSVASYGDYTVAEHAFALILAVARRLREAMTARGNHFSYADIRGMELKGKTLGLIGAGRVGRHVVALARAFGMKVLACDIREDADAAGSLGFRYVSLDELLGESHILSLHASLTPESFHILDRAAFAKCRPGVLVINTARGRLIDTAALIEALDVGVVGGAGLDVLGEERVMRQKATHIITDQITRRIRGEDCEECRIGDRTRVQQFEKLILLEDLLSRPNVVFTPHIAFNTVEAIERINRATVENIREFPAGHPLNDLPHR